MRLLYVSHSFPPPGRPLANVGGMQRIATELHDALAADPRVHLTSLLLRTSWRWTHLRVLPFNFGLLRRIPRIVEREGIDVVLFSSMVTAAVAVPLRRRLTDAGVLTAAIPVGRDVTLPIAAYQRFLPRVFDALDVVLPISRATAAECTRRGVPEHKMDIVPCGVEPARFPAPAAPRDRAAARRGLVETLGDAGEPLPSGALLLCSVGRHVERKGFAWFVDRVMPSLPADVHFWLAGEGPQTPAVRQAIERHGLGGRVRLLGRIPDDALAALYRGADLFVMPNVPVPGDIEGFGVVMLEAGLCGLPIIGARLEGIEDAIRDGENGTLLTSGDTAAFAQAIQRYHDDRAALASASARAVRYTAAHFTWPAIADRYLQALQSAMDRSGRRAPHTHTVETGRTG